MTYYLTSDAVLKRLEAPSVYRISSDELYELDEESFAFLEACASERGAKSSKNEFMEYCINEGLLTDLPLRVRRPPAQQSPSPSLRYLELQITDRCNLRCRHCYVGDGSSIDLPADIVRRVLRDFEEMQGLRLLITGGEPLLHPRFEMINDMLPEFALRKVLFTNGLLLTGEMLRRLHVDEIQVSIDGLGETHDLIRGIGTFVKSMDAVRRCINVGIDVSVATMVHKDNLADLPHMEQLLKEIGVKDWTVDVPCVTGRLKDNPDLVVTPESGGPALRYGFGGGFHGGAEGYACGLHLMSVSARGLASRCTFYAARAVGSIEEGLGHCWERIRPIPLGELGCDCSYINECRGGCRYRTEASGNPLGKDLYKCHLYDIMGSGKRGVKP